MDKSMIIRTIVLVIALLNQALVMFGWSPLPFEAEEVEHGVTVLFTTVATLWAWYRNNDITREGKAGTELTRELKRQKKLDK